MSKTIVFLADGMADDALPELDGRTPLEYASTPNMDRIAAAGASGTFISLPTGTPTSSDVANMSILGYDPNRYYRGRGPFEALSRGISLGSEDIAFRCNLVHVEGDILLDYSGGRIGNADFRRLMADLAAETNCEEIHFHPGLSYRNLLILHGERFTARINYSEPDVCQGLPVADILPQPVPDNPKSEETCRFLIDLMQSTRLFLDHHPVNAEREKAANMIWPWSGGGRISMPSFEQKFGVQGAVISAVDLIFGLGIAIGLDPIRVSGATGFVDTNYEGKAAAAIKALNDYDFVYLHVEAIDECGHMGNLELKLQAIADFDQRLVGPVMDELGMQGISYAILPDHAVPVRKKSHTRAPVPFAVCGPHLTADKVDTFNEKNARSGALGRLEGDQLMTLLLNPSQTK